MTKDELAEIRERYDTQDMAYVHSLVNSGRIFEDIPKLLDEVERLQKAIVDLEELLDYDGYSRV